MAANTDLILKATRRYSSTIGVGGVADAVVSTIPLTSVTGLPTDTAIEITIDRVDASGNLTLAKEEVVRGVISGSNLINAVRGVEGTAQTHTAGAIVEMRLTADAWNRHATAFLTEHNQDGTHGTSILKATSSPTISGTFSFDTAPKYTFGTEAAGDLFYGSADGTLVRLPKGTDGQIIQQVSGIPAWTSGTTGTLIGTPQVSTLTSFSSTATTYTDSGLTVTFTPSNNSLCLVLLSLNWYNSGDNSNYARILLDGTVQGFTDALVTDFATGAGAVDSASHILLTGLSNTAHTIKVQIRTAGSTLAMNSARLTVIPWL